MSTCKFTGLSSTMRIVDGGGVPPTLSISLVGTMGCLVTERVREIAKAVEVEGRDQPGNPLTQRRRRRISGDEILCERIKVRDIANRDGLTQAAGNFGAPRRLAKIDRVN